jgi:hypothetical protein
MGRNYGSGGEENDCFEGTGGAAGQYGSQTPLDRLHRRGGSEQAERKRIQAEETQPDPAPFGSTAGERGECDR